jgi:hypothetical protein
MLSLNALLFDEVSLYVLYTSAFNEPPERTFDVIGEITSEHSTSGIQAVIETIDNVYTCCNLQTCACMLQIVWGLVTKKQHLQ